MDIAVLGTGVVGQTIAGKLIGLGHAVTLGTRNVGETMARSQPARGTLQPAAWLEAHPSATLATFADAAAAGEVVFVATNGQVTLEALQLAGAANLAGKVVIDISNPLDFSRGFPPMLSVCNDDSIGEQVQRAFPDAKVVKSLNTINADLMVNPRDLADADHHVFVSGNDDGAKAEVTRILVEWFGWRHVVDLGDITTARGTEMYLALWTRLFARLGTASYNVKVVQ